MILMILIKLEGEALLFPSLLDQEGTLEALDLVVEECILSCNVVQTSLKLLDVLTVLILHLTAYN